MRNKLLITLDVEPDCDTKWRRSNPLTFTSVTFGIPRILRPIWDKYDIKPIYFISPEVVKNKECCKVLKSEIRKGAIIGTHLHSEFIEPYESIKNPEGEVSMEFPCIAHSTKNEYLKIRNLTKLIIKNLGVKPEWYRAARFGADLETIRSLKKLGYKYDSSVTPRIKWNLHINHSKAPDQPYPISKNNYYKAGIKDRIGIIEYPITIGYKRFGFFGRFLPSNWIFYSWMRPSHMSYSELRNLTDDFLKKYKTPTIVMMFHSMEIMPGKSPFVRNKFMQRMFLERLVKIIGYLRSRGIK